MTRHFCWLCILLASVAFGAALLAAPHAATAASDTPEASASDVELFQGMADGTIDGKIVMLNDHEGRILLTNNTKQPLNVKLPEAFAAVPVLAQFGGGGGGRGGGGRSSSSSSSGNSNQSSGGGLGGGGLSGGGGGMFSIPPEKTGKIEVPMLCLEHGKRDPSSAIPYKMMPADEYTDRPAVVELLKSFGRGELQHGAAQAAAWHLNNDLSWEELAAKKQGTTRSMRRPPYFSHEEMQAAMGYANAAIASAENAEPKEKKATEEPSSESRSTKN
jgi:hypothetical protein